ncbi:relaxase/mobilization nuclease domain-containing protein [Lactiplantibacillus carotarum]|uniref:relaxase/mobilization nuclease domain-containing protein n=2 Tax=Lactiplantibacillus carotarum TaxID=2993456 RepID=UPI002478A10C|nr:relaxase/mobilization nuclease domain-containing protein [Lactiplantibacillus carotarum]
MATTHIKRSTSASRLVNYAEKRAVKKDGLNLDIQYAKSEFKQVRDIYGNPGKTQAYASRIAFSPLEFNPKDPHDQTTVLAVAKEVYAKAYPHQQVALYEHADTDSLHVHAVIGAINLETGQKMHGNWHQYRDHLVHITDQVCQKHGLMVTQPDPNRHEKRSMAEIKLRAQHQPTWKDQIRQAVDHTMQNPLIRDFQAFQDDLKQQAVKVWERGKHLTYQLLGTNYKSRGPNSGLIMKRRRFLMSWQADKTNQEPTSQNKDLMQQLTQLNQTLTELRNYQGTQIQLQSTAKTSLDQQLHQIEQTAQQVNQQFQTTLNNLDSSNASSQAQLKQTLQSAYEGFKKQTNLISQENLTALKQIQTEQAQNNQRLGQLSDQVNQTIQETMAQVANQVDQQLQTTKKRLSWYEIKNYLLAVIPTGILTGLIFWLLTRCLG